MILCKFVVCCWRGWIEKVCSQAQKIEKNWFSEFQFELVKTKTEVRLVRKKQLLRHYRRKIRSILAHFLTHFYYLSLQFSEQIQQSRMSPWRENQIEPMQETFDANFTKLRNSHIIQYYLQQDDDSISHETLIEDFKMSLLYATDSKDRSRKSCRIHDYWLP